MAAMTTREIYPNAPVVLVAVEARHPEVAPLTQGEQSELKRLLATRFPLPQPVQSRSITTSIGNAPTLTEQTIPRFASRDQTTAVTFGPQRPSRSNRPGTRRSSSSPSSCSSRSRRANVSLQSTALFVLACATSTRSGFRSSVTVRLVGPTGLTQAFSVHPPSVLDSASHPAAGKELPYLTGGRAATHCPIRSARRLRGPARRAAPPVHAGSGRIFPSGHRQLLGAERECPRVHRCSGR